MMRSLFALLLLLLALPAHAQHWSRSWAAAPVEVSRDSDPPLAELKDRTIRQVVRLSTGGEAIRLRLSNVLSDARSPWAR